MTGLLFLVLAADPSPAAVFKQRIEPIFRSPNPSSCVQCHLAGVDLKDYIRPDAEQTFRSLRDQGLIDLAAPEKSKIVRLIDMGADKPGPAVPAAARTAEREAFLAWIAACAADPALRAAPPLPEAQRAKPARPDAVIRHARTDRLLDGFERDVWAWRFRCMNCHTAGTPQNDKLVAEHGARVAWVKGDDAATTMSFLLGSKLIDTARPEQSKLLQKPLGDDHGGGVKFAVGDDAYKGFRRWLEDAARVRRDGYATAAELPAAGPKRFGTDLWLKLTDLPPTWAGKLLRVEVFAWEGGRWGDAPVAVSDRPVADTGGLWQHNLTLLGSVRPAMADGRYQVRLGLDRDGRLAKDWRAELGPADAVGRVEVQAKWRPGYGKMVAASGRELPH